MGRSFSGAFGRYQLVGVIGRGSMGVVFRARDPVLTREVALKVMDTESVAFGTQRLLREAQAMARVIHPNVVTVFDAGWCHEVPFVAMQLVEGVGLEAWLHRSRDWREVTGVFRQAAEGLAAVHRAGLVHRDFKPSNAVLGHDGIVRVVDFGLARLATTRSCTGQGGSARCIETTGGTVDVFLGTPAYMAPEQHLGHPLDARCDIYAFGCSLYEALAGRKPFLGRNAHGLLLDKQEQACDPLPRTTPRWLCTLVRRCLEPDPAERLASMAEASEILSTAPARTFWRPWPTGSSGRSRGAGC